MVKYSEIEETKRRLRQLEEEKKREQKKCSHVFDEPKYDPIIMPAYRCPEERMGSDYRPEIYVPEKRTPRWSQTCTKCEYVQYTQKTKVIQTKPDFD